jgi:hypothetical protein
VSAGKALTMPGVVLISHSASRDDLHKSKKVNGSSVKKSYFSTTHSQISNYLGAFDASSGELLLIASGAVNVLLARDERLGADRSLAHEAAEALFVPLPTLVFHLLGSCTHKHTDTIASTKNEI